MDELNTVNDVQEGNVDFQETEANAALTNEPQEGETSAEPISNASEVSEAEVASGDGDHKEVAKERDYERDHMFAEMRKKAEQYGRQKAEAEFAPVKEALKNYGYEGNSQELADALNAANEGISIEEYQNRRNEREEAIRNHPYVRQLLEENESLKDEARESRFKEIAAEDLAQIKKAYPDCKANHVVDLGEKFIAMRSIGFDCIEAYEACRSAEKVNKAPTVGKTGSSNTEVVSEFYTYEEAMDLVHNHPERLENPKELAKLNRSRGRW